MRITFSSFVIILSLPLLMTGAGTTGVLPGPPSFASNYHLVFGKDFTTMTSLSQLGVSSTSIGSGSWIAHTPTNQDYFTFEDPTANYKPFGVGNGYLDIRVQQDGNDPHNYFAGFSGGLLSSMDSSGSGFAQQYGYFECSMWSPGSPNIWPAFWLLSAPNLTNPNLPYLAEIDVMEIYGNYGTGPNQTPPGNPNTYSVAWYNRGQNGNATTTAGSFFNESGLTTGYHTYGVDVEPSGISWYFDRQLVWQAPIFAAAQQPLLVMVNLALGGGNFNNSTNTGYNWALTPNPTDLKVQYVAVWASPSSPNYVASGAPAPPTALSATGGNAQIALTWAASSGATNYDIYRGSSPGGETMLASGIGGTSYTDNTVIGTSTYYYKVAAVNASGVSGMSNEANAAALNIGSGTLPSPWRSQDIGNTWATGGSAYSGGVFSLKGAGNGAYYVPDGFQYAYQLVSGDCSIIARVTAQASSNSSSHAGVMIRDGLANNSGFADVTLYPNAGGAYFQYRADGGNPNSLSGLGSTPYWLKITRTGNIISGAVSPNGTTWTTLGSTTLIMPSTVYLGLLETSGVDGVLASSTFDNVSVTTTGGGSAPPAVPAAPGGLSATGADSQITLQWSASSGATSYNVYRGSSSGSETLLATGASTTSYTDNTAVNGTTYYYKVAAVNSSGVSGRSNEATATATAPPTGGGGGLPSPWSNQDIGNTWATGGAAYANGVFSLMGAGNGAFYVPDGFQYAYQLITGDCSIVARVTTQATASNSRAGVMIRDSLANNSGFADLALYANGGGAFFQYRPDGGSPSSVSGVGSTPYWVKVTRSGNTFTGSVSPNGTTWTTVGSTTLSMPSAIYVGLLQASGSDGVLTTSTFANVAVTH